jgi:hypothetical protein
MWGSTSEPHYCLSTFIMLNMKVRTSLAILIKSHFVSVILVLSLILSVMIMSCDDKTSTSKFSDTYLQILVAREQIKDSAKASTKVAEILKEHGFTEETFRQEFMRLSRSPKEFRAIMDSIQAQAGRLK